MCGPVGCGQGLDRTADGRYSSPHVPTGCILMRRRLLFYVDTIAGSRTLL